MMMWRRLMWILLFACPLGVLPDNSTHGIGDTFSSGRNRSNKSQPTVKPSSKQTSPVPNLRATTNPAHSSPPKPSIRKSTSTAAMAPSSTTITKIPASQGNIIHSATSITSADSSMSINSSTSTTTTTPTSTIPTSTPQPSSNTEASTANTSTSPSTETTTTSSTSTSTASNTISSMSTTTKKPPSNFSEKPCDTHNNKLEKWRQYLCNVWNEIGERWKKTTSKDAGTIFDSSGLLIGIVVGILLIFLVAMIGVCAYCCSLTKRSKHSNEEVIQSAAPTKAPRKKSTHPLPKKTLNTANPPQPGMQKPKQKKRKGKGKKHDGLVQSAPYDPKKFIQRGPLHMHKEFKDELVHDMDRSDKDKTIKIDKFVIDENLNDVHDIGTIVDVMISDTESKRTSLESKPNEQKSKPSQIKAPKPQSSKMSAARSTAKQPSGH